MSEKFIPTHTKENSKLNRRRAITPIILIVLLLCALAAGTVAAKYVYERNSEGVVIASYFYFTSDFLDGATHTLAPGSTSVSFTVGNHADDLRFSEVDINYEVTIESERATEKATVKINNEDKSTGTLEKGSVKDAEIIISDLQPGHTYTVEAVGVGAIPKP